MHQKAPFNPEQIKALQLYQTCGLFHPYTCSCLSPGKLPLVPYECGLMCWACFKIQNWALNWTTDFSSVSKLITSMKGALLMNPTVSAD